MTTKLRNLGLILSGLAAGLVIAVAFTAPSAETDAAESGKADDLNGAACARWEFTTQYADTNPAFGGTGDPQVVSVNEGWEPFAARTTDYAGTNTLLLRRCAD